MSVRRAALGLLGLGLSLPLACGPAGAAEPRSGFVEVHSEPARAAPPPVAPAAPADLSLTPSVAVERQEAPSLAPVPTPVAAAPTAPAVEADPVRTGSLVDLPLPAPPAAPVTVSEAETLAGAIELRLGDARSVWLPRTPRRDRDAIASFYAAAANRPAWIQGGAWSAPARALIERLGHADEDGLEVADYPIPVVGAGGRPAPMDLAEADLKLSVAAALYARDARGGRIDPTRLSALITPKLELPAPDAVLSELSRSADPGTALAAYNPAYPGYRALRAKLAEVRARRPAGQPMVRRLHRPDLTTTQSIATLDDAPAIRPDAWSNPRLEGDIVANMERWRWLPKDVAPRSIFVNIPEYRLRILDGTRVIHETRVITGKPDSPTPLFSGLVEYAVVNPSWYLPPSILKKEFLPKLAADPTYAARLGYDVVRHGNAISIRQPPGEKNALGFIKFMFPNQHAVYLHDTPNRSLFSASRRAFSHGCVRVEDPFQLADMLLGSAWSETRLRKLIGHGERTIWLPEKIPVHLAYFTMSVDEGGDLRSFEDIYGYNRKVRAALGLGA